MTILRRERQQRRARTDVGAVAANLPIRIERTRVTIARTAPTAEPRTAGIHEVRVRPAPGLIVTGDRLDSHSFVSSSATACLKSTDIIVVILLR